MHNSSINYYFTLCAVVIVDFLLFFFKFYFSLFFLTSIEIYCLSSLCETKLLSYFVDICDSAEVPNRIMRCSNDIVKCSQYASYIKLAAYHMYIHYTHIQTQVPHVHINYVHCTLSAIVLYKMLQSCILFMDNEKYEPVLAYVQFDL